MEPPADTSAEAYQIQIQALRQMGEAGRAAATLSLIELARNATMAGIRSRHPDYDDERVRLAFARIVLGDDIVRRIWPGRDLVEP
jgi:hypothetical protein